MKRKLGSGSVSICAKRRTRSFLSYKIPRRVKIKQYQTRLESATDTKTSKKKSSKFAKLKDTRRNRRKLNLLRKHRVRSEGMSRGQHHASEEKTKASWLETHIWHTKRMHMKDLWGLRLGYKCMSRGKRFVLL